MTHVAQTFLTGYNLGLQHEDTEQLGAALVAAVSKADQGFAFEGAAMATFIFDTLVLGLGTRFQRLFEYAGSTHAYMLHVGAGWAVARLPFRVQDRLLSADPLLRWLRVDGYGFHEGFFHGRDYLERGRRPPLSGYAARAFDQGLGRSLWFFHGAAPDAIAGVIARLAGNRHADLWSGVGLAAAYAGGGGAPPLHTLRTLARKQGPALAQGAAFAAAARLRAGNSAKHTDEACRILAGVPAETACDVVDQVRTSLDQVPEDESNQPAYERWRAGVQMLLSRHAAAQGAAAQSLPVRS